MRSNIDELITVVSNKVLESQKQPLLIEEIIKYQPNEGYSNELLFFIKPEITQCTKQTINNVLKMIFYTFDKYNICVSGLVILGAEGLRKYDLISKHYGVINTISKYGLKELSEKAKVNFNSIFNNGIDNVKVLGALEFMERFDYFNELSLNVLWENQKSYKLSSGTYCEKIKLFEEEIFLLNGFHPYQIFQYTRKGSSLIAFILQTNTNWKILRTEMIGDTDTSKADKNSIRRVLLDNKDELGILQIGQGYNGVHLSAGPIEALTEIIRFMSNYTENKKLMIYDTAIGNYMLNKGLNETNILHFMQNPILNVNGQKISVFDLTEEKDVNECVDILIKFKNITQ